MGSYLLTVPAASLCWQIISSWIPMKFGTQVCVYHLVILITVTSQLSPVQRIALWQVLQVPESKTNRLSFFSSVMTSLPQHHYYLVFYFSFILPSISPLSPPCNNFARVQYHSQQQYLINVQYLRSSESSVQYYLLSVKSW